MPQETISDTDIALAPPSSFSGLLSDDEDGSSSLEATQRQQHPATSGVFSSPASILFSWFHIAGLNSNGNSNCDPGRVKTDTADLIERVFDIDNCNSEIEPDFFSSSSSRVVTIAATPNFPSDDSCSSSSNGSAPSQINQQEQQQSQSGSSISGAVFNFTNCIVGAGCIGLGGAFAESGGLISVLSVIFFAFLVKQSADLVLELSIGLASEYSRRGNNRNQQHLATYEELGQESFGTMGKYLVLGSKLLYSFGCLIAYTKVIQDNFGVAVKNIIYGNQSNNKSWLYFFLDHDIWTTYTISTIVVLPLCLLRDMTPLSSFSLLSVAAMGSIIAIVFYYWASGDISNTHSSELVDAIFYSHFNVSDGTILVGNLSLDLNTSYASASENFHRHWIEIRWIGYLNNIGTFVFSFVCQHTAHMTFNSLKPDLRSMKQWKKVSTAALTVSTILSLAVGLLVYMTFWQDAVSDMFQLYPSSILMDIAKLLLCITMLLTFPLPFFTCRELIVLILFPSTPDCDINNSSHYVVTSGNSHGASYPSTLIETSEHSNDVMLHGDTLSELREPLMREPLTRSIRTSSNGEETQNSFYTARSQHSAPLSSLARHFGDDLMMENINVVQNDIGNISPPRLLRRRSAETVSLNDLSMLSTRAIEMMNSCLLPGHERQLKLPFHFAVTAKLWFVVTGLAVAAPSLGDILALVGCVSGTLIAFILPGLFALKLQGFRPLVVVLLVVGSFIGVVGSFCSIRQFALDTFD